MKNTDVGKNGEDLVEEIARLYGFEVTRHINSGATFGDSDMTIHTEPPVVASVKATTKKNQTSIIIPRKDWKKAGRQAGTDIPIFVNIGEEKTVTLSLEDFFYLLVGE